jgi:hypothetical protein
VTQRTQTGVGRSLLAAALAGLACAGSGPTPIRYVEGAGAQVTSDGLHRVEARGIDAAYLRPGASFQGYRALLIEPVSVSYKSPPSRPGSLRRGEGNRALTALELKRLQKAFDGALAEELTGSRHFLIASEPGPEVLRVAPYIIDLVLNTPVERAGEVVLVSLSGEMTGVLELTDSLEPVSLGRLVDRRLVQPGGPSGALRRAGVLEEMEMERIFARWARVFRRGLEDLAAYETVPQRESNAPR